MMGIHSTDSRSGMFIRLAVSFMMVISLLCSGAASAKLFIQFEGIKGESTDEKHQDWIEAWSVQWSVSVTQSCSGGGPQCETSKPTLSDLYWSQSMDKSFPSLFGEITGKNDIAKATVDFTTTIGDTSVTYFQMVFDKPILTSLTASSGGDHPSVSGSFAYSKIDMTYKQLDGKGNLIKGGETKASYDLNKAQASAAALMSVFSLGMSGPDIVSAIPEPDVFAMMLAGIGLLGFVTQYRKLKAGL